MVFVCSHQQQEIHNGIAELLLLLLGLFPLLLLFKGVFAVAREFRMCAKDGHVGLNARDLINLFIYSVRVNRAESKHLVDQLTILQKLLKVDNEVLHCG